MKKNLFLRLYLIMTVLLFLNSCRQEYFQSDAENQKNQFQVSLLNRQEVNKIAPLMGKIAELKKSSFKQSNSFSARKVLDSLLEGAIIGTNEVLVVDNGHHKTYTFPIFRTFISKKTESLVLKQNEDGSFKGILIQYDITKQEKEQLINGQNLDISAKTKIYDIENIDLNTSARVQVDVVGCYKITWETGWCSKGVHQTGQDATCEVGGAPAPFIQSIEDICDSSNTGTNAPGGYLGIGSNGVSLDLGNYFTISFISIGHQYYETEDPNDPNYVLYNTVASYFSMLGTEVVQLRAANPDLFYYAYYYFKDNGVNSTTRSFITQRLLGLKNWYGAANNTPNTIPANNQYFLNWAFQHLVLNPDITWAEFYNEYLATPCEKTKALVNNANIKPKIDAMKDQSKLPYSDPNYGETGYKFDANGMPTPKITGGKHDVDLGDTAGYSGAYHNHTELGTNMLSPADIIKLLDFSLARTNGNIKDGYLGMIGSEVCSSCTGGYKYYHYIINFNGNMSELTQYAYNTTWDLKQLKKDYREHDKELADNPLCK